MASDFCHLHLIIGAEVKRYLGCIGADINLAKVCGNQGWVVPGNSYEINTLVPVALCTSSTVKPSNIACPSRVLPFKCRKAVRGK